MISITNLERRNIAMSVFSSVFGSFDVFDLSLDDPAIHHSLLGVHQLSDEELEAIICGGKVEGDRTAFHLIRGGIDAKAVWSEVLEYSLDPSPFKGTKDSLPHPIIDILTPVTEYAIVSPRGQWGVLISEDWVTLASGPKRFIDALESQGLASEDGVSEFLDYSTQVASWPSESQDDVRADVLKLLRAVVGDDEAKELVDRWM